MSTRSTSRLLIGCAAALLAATGAPASAAPTTTASATLTNITFTLEDLDSSTA